MSTDNGSRRADAVGDLPSYCTSWPDVDVQPTRPGYQIWYGKDRRTGDRVWVVDFVEEDGTVFNIAVTPNREHVAKFIRQIDG